MNLQKYPKIGATGNSAGDSDQSLRPKSLGECCNLTVHAVDVFHVDQRFSIVENEETGHHSPFTSISLTAQDVHSQALGRKSRHFSEESHGTLAPI